MKVLLFVSRLSAGGAEQAAVLLASGFIELSHEVTIAAASLRGDLIKRLDARCKIVDLASKKPIRSMRHLAACIRKVRPDAVVCFGFSTGIAAALSKLIFRWGTKIIIRNENNLRFEWQTAGPLNRLIGPPLSRWSARQSSVVAVSHTLAKATAEYLGLDPKNVTTILNPVLNDTEPCTEAPESDLHPWLRNQIIPTFVAVGRLEYQKGFDLLVAAFARVRSSTHARLVIFGRGSLYDVLQAQIDAHGLHEDIELAGFTANPIAQMRAAHAFVLSSRFEGFGLVLVEALWSGTQVISTDCEFGPAEVLEGGRFGTLVPVNDVNTLAAAMLASIHQPHSAARPPDSWFEQFTATRAACEHASLIGTLH